MDSSFYGGLPGFSCVIVKTFASYNDMVTEFKKGSSCTDVHYEEYVLINTENKNDPTNGSLYRRGYDYTNDDGGAIYVGTIVGPAGPAPMLEMTTVADIEDKYKTELGDSLLEYNARDDFPAEGVASKYYKDKSTNVIYYWDSGIKDYIVYSRYSNGEYAPTANLIPGKYVENNTNKYNDEITWACYSIRDENGTDTFAYIGFIFPYLVVDYTATSVDAYTKPSTKRTDDKTHPFYEAWQISVPKGVKGDSVDGLSIVTLDEDSTITYNNTDKDKVTTAVKNKSQVLVYNTRNYDSNSTGTTSANKYIANYNIIEEIAIDDDYNLLIYYTADRGDVTYNNKSGWTKIGQVKDYNGILVGLNLSRTDGPTVNNINADVSYLNEHYSGGLSEINGKSLKGKVVTIGDTDKNKKFYAYDYEKDTWFYLGTIGESTDAYTIFAKENADDLITLQNSLQTGGVWFVVEGDES